MLLCQPQSTAERFNFTEVAVLENIPFAAALNNRVRDRDGRQEGFGVRMLRVAEYILCFALFNDYTMVHNSNPVRDMADDCQVMGNEKVGNLQLCLQILKKVDNSCLDGYIK